MEELKFEDNLQRLIDSQSYNRRIILLLLLNISKTARAYVNLFFSLFTRLVLATEEQVKTFKDMY